MKKIAFVSFFLIFIIFNANSQKKIPTGHYYGINAGFTTGVGFAYRYFPNKFGVQITAVGIKTEENWNDMLEAQAFFARLIPVKQTIGRNNDYANVGLSVFYSLKKYKHYNIFTYAGGSYTAYTEGYYTLKEREIYNSGAGLGLAFNSTVGFNVMLGYQVNDILGKQNYVPTIELSLLIMQKKKVYEK